MDHLVVITLRLGKPLEGECWLKPQEGFAGARPQSAELVSGGSGKCEAAFRNTQQFNIHLAGLFQFKTLGEQGRSESSSGHDVTEVAMRQLRAGRPFPTPALGREEGGADS